MVWEILLTDEYQEWFLTLTHAEQVDVMAIPLHEFRKKIDPQVQSEARAKAVTIVAEMSLADMRRLRGKNQVELAKVLKVAQPNVSQMESRPDALVSTLRQYIEALGGKLEIHAKFPDGQDVEIAQFRGTP